MISDLIPATLSNLLGRPLTVIRESGARYEVKGIVKRKPEVSSDGSEGYQVHTDALYVSIAERDLPFRLTSRDRIEWNQKLYEISYPQTTANGMIRALLLEAAAEDE